MRILEGILISQKSLMVYFKSQTGVDLWRAFRTDEAPKLNPLQPDLEERRLPNNDIRKADLNTVPTRFGRYVRANLSMGCSLMDISNGFGHEKMEVLLHPSRYHYPLTPHHHQRLAYEETEVLALFHLA